MNAQSKFFFLTIDYIIKTFAYKHNSLRKKQKMKNNLSTKKHTYYIIRKTNISIMYANASSIINQEKIYFSTKLWFKIKYKNYSDWNLFPMISSNFVLTFCPGAIIWTFVGGGAVWASVDDASSAKSRFPTLDFLSTSIRINALIAFKSWKK